MPNLEKFARKDYRDDYLENWIRGKLSNQIYAMRKKLGLNQTQFAERIGRTQSFVSELEHITDHPTINVHTLINIARALDVALVVEFASYPDFLSRSSSGPLTLDTIHESLEKLRGSNENDQTGDTPTPQEPVQGQGAGNISG